MTKQQDSKRNVNRRGHFLVFEGIDGSGKSTQLAMLADMLRRREIPVYPTAEPSEGDIGRLLRSYLTGQRKADPRVFAPLFAADRLDHLTREKGGLLPRIAEGTTILSDRYYLSSLAYQSVDLPMETVIAMNRPCMDLLRPDLTIFIDVTPETAMNRIANGRTSTELFEKRDRLAATREKFFEAIRRLHGEEKIAIIDGNRPAGSIAGEIQEMVISMFASDGC